MGEKGKYDYNKIHLPELDGGRARQALSLSINVISVYQW
jgi:hypothetical protein